jgi:hypothetical protein
VSTRLGSRVGVLVLVVATTPALARATTREVTAGPEYAAGGFHRLMLGAGYRRLWTTPIKARTGSRRGPGPRGTSERTSRAPGPKAAPWLLPRDWSRN